MTAILQNNVFHAAMCADVENVKWQNMRELIKCITAHAPRGSFGDAKKVNGWLKQNKLYKAHSKQIEKDILFEILKSEWN